MSFIINNVRQFCISYEHTGNNYVSRIFLMFFFTLLGTIILLRVSEKRSVCHFVLAKGTDFLKILKFFSAYDLNLI